MAYSTRCCCQLHKEAKKRTYTNGNKNEGLKELDFSLEGAIILVASGSFRTYQSLITEHTPGSDNFQYDLEGVRQHAQGFSVDGHRYFLEGKLGLLDVEGEWSHSPDDTMLYLWAPGGGSLNGSR